ncbi:MAG: response regulator [Devosia sp.]|nr:response regulator [Devosia sp.]
MTETAKLVAILAANPALTSILAKPLAREPGLRVCEFATGQALVTFMRIAPLDLIVMDADSDGASALDFVRSLRINRRLASAQFDIIALTRAVIGFHQTLLDAGVDDVLGKPVSTTDLVGRVTVRLAQGRPHAYRDGVYGGPERRTSRRTRQPMNHCRGEARPGNVVPLFGGNRPGIASKT